MNVLLVVSAAYAISIPLVFWFEAENPEETATPGIYSRAAKNFPRFGRLFSSVEKIMLAINSPAIVLVVVMCLPYLVLTSRKKYDAYSDPCFQIIPDHILETAQRVQFANYRDQLLELRFYSEGIFKYRQRKLTELVEYFTSRHGTAIAIYCINGEFQICVASFTHEGRAVVTSGLPEKRFDLLNEKETRTEQFLRTHVASTDPRVAIETHIKVYKSRYSEKPFRVKNDNWKQAFIYLERLKCQTETCEKECPAPSWDTVSIDRTGGSKGNLQDKNATKELTPTA